MRWKEHFLVPDHKVRTINGASFEGFYYICFNQIHGTVSGIYFHAKSEKYVQPLEVDTAKHTDLEQVPTTRAKARRGSGMLCSNGISMNYERMMTAHIGWMERGIINGYRYRQSSSDGGRKAERGMIMIVIAYGRYGMEWSTVSE
jgi:hypothetical protein